MSEPTVHEKLLMILGEKVPGFTLTFPPNHQKFIDECAAKPEGHLFTTVVVKDLGVYRVCSSCLMNEKVSDGVVIILEATDPFLLPANDEKEKTQ